MKNYLTEVFNSSIFRFVQRLMMVFLSLSLSCAATATTYYSKVYVNSNPTAAGKVYVNTSNSKPGTAKQSAEQSKENSTHTYYFWAETVEGYGFDAWKDGNTEISSSPDFSKNVTGMSNTPKEYTYTAYFKPLIEVKNKVEDGNRIPLIKKNNDRANVEIIVNTFKTGTLTATLSGPKQNHFSFSNVTGEIMSEKAFNGDASGEKEIRFRIYEHDAVDDDEITLTLSSSNAKNKSVSYTIYVKAPAVVTYKPSQYGAYTVAQSGTSASETLPQSSTEDKYFYVNDDAEKSFSISATPATGYRLYAAKIIKASNPSAPEYKYYNTENLSVTPQVLSGLELSENADVELLFVPATSAAFIVKWENPVVYYTNPDEAFKNGTVVVLEQGGDLMAGNYTVPSGCTLVIPATDTYKTDPNAHSLMDGDLSNSHWSSYGQAEAGVFTEHRRLVLNNGVKISVEGSLTVEASELRCGTGDDQIGGLPKRYGIIEMAKGSLIDVENNGKLSCYGYIINTYNEGESITTNNFSTMGRVYAKSGAKVWERFMLNSWRGGTATTTDLYKNADKVFPITQYYIQSVEVPMTLEPGATERLVVGVDVSSEVIINMDFIVQNGSGKYGLFRMGDYTSLTKYYCVHNDRQVYVLSKNDGTELNGSIISYMYMPINVNVLFFDTSFDLLSSDYVMPIMNNMDIYCINNESSPSLSSPFNITVAEDVAFLAGSTCSIDEYSQITIASGKRAYIYDKDQNTFSDGTGYYGAGDWTLIPLIKRPDVGMKFFRTVDNLSDASIIIDGSVVVNGALYTTASGASITSTASGKLYLNSKGSESTTTQYDQTDGKFKTIPLTTATTSSPMLLNGDGSYVENTTAPNVYTYSGSGDAGKWLGSADAGIGKVTNPNFPILTMPSDDNILQGVIECELLIPEGERFTEDDFNVAITANANDKYTQSGHSVENGKLRIPITYTQQNIDGEFVLTLSVTSTHNKLLGLNQVINVTVVEDYQPAYSINSDNPEFVVTGQIGLQNNCALPISAIISNVTTLTPGANALASTETDSEGKTIYVLTGHSSNIKWKAQISDDANDEFSFQFGSAENCLSGANVIFAPKGLSSSANDKTATLTIIATYTDAAAEEHTTIKMLTLKGTSTKQKNEYTLTTTKNVFINESLYLFTNLGANIEDMSFVQSGTGAVSISKQASGNYLLTGTAVGDVNIVINQPATDTHEGYSAQFNISVLATVTWNWSTLYYGYTYDNPITTNETGWSIELKEGTSCGEYLSLTGNNLVVGVPEEKQECTATFIYKKGSYIVDMPALLSPARMLDVAVSKQAMFDALEYANNATIFATNNGSPSICLTSTNNVQASWTMQFVGMPAELEFAYAGGNNNWTIEESPDAIAWNYIVRATRWDLNKTINLSLKPTTRYIRFTYSSGETTNTGVLSNVCVKKLYVKSDVSKLYLPVGKTKQITLTHTSPFAPSINEVSGLTITPSEPVNKGTYYETILTISSSVVGDFKIIATQGSKTAEIDVVAFNFPLTLPLQSSEWTNTQSDYYYRYMTESNNVSWNESTQEVIMHFTTSPREVVFAFKGGPSEVSFVSSSPINTDDWEILESADGNVFTTKSSKDMRTINGNTFVQTLSEDSYTTRYIKIRYIASVPDEIRLTNVVITGEAGARVNPKELRLTNTVRSEELTVTAINLQRVKLVSENPHFHIVYGLQEGTSVTLEPSLDDAVLSAALGDWEVGDISVTIKWVGTSLVNEGLIKVVNPDDADDVLATVKLLGSKSTITLDDANKTGIWTGVSSDYQLQTNESVLFEPYMYHEVDVTHAFSTDGEKRALFDYLFIYGETTTTDGSANITIPDHVYGSNAKTPYYIYVRSADGKGYDFHEAVENANAGSKAQLTFADATTTEDPETHVRYYSIRPQGEKTHLGIYMTGFCPYASTGFTKYDEGVWHIQGDAGESVNIYLEDCHIYSRNKTENGRAFAGKDGEDDSFFTEKYVRGSGGVFVLEFVTEVEFIDEVDPFEVTFTTRGNNLLKSNYGSFFELMQGMRAYQVSSPIQVHLHTDKYLNNSKVTLNFNDQWPISSAINAPTNGFLSLQKQHNNAPSIDLGNALTTVNFKGGRIELQNAAIVSTNYKTTLAISHRSGEMGIGGATMVLAYGIGTDAVGGTVNFYDGTTTVRSMTVDEKYRGYYLMDTQTEKDSEGNDIITELPTTSCLRCPTNTYIYGGSHCMIRSCNSVTSKGGAPKDGPEGQVLGKFEYTLVTEGENKDLIDPVTKLVTINAANFPTKCFLDYYKDNANYAYQEAVNQRSYGLKSVTPKDGKLTFWLPALDCAGDFAVTPETDALLSTWRACMTTIGASYAGRSATIGGDQAIGQDEQVKYLLYCQLDEDIHNVISETEIDGDKVDNDGNPVMRYVYQAPVVDPTGQLKGDDRFIPIRPTNVGEERQYEITNTGDYKVTDRIYYITTAMSDVWMNFTMPFDVQNIYIVESFDENVIAGYETDDAIVPAAGETKRDAIKRIQAKHNADFAAFFGVAMALGTDKTFEQIYDNYLDWAKNKADRDNGLYAGTGSYNLRGKYLLKHYDGTNFKTSNFYLYKNTEDWTIVDDEYAFKTNWQIVPKQATNAPLMHKGQTYSMLFPYCQGCDVEVDQNGNVVLEGGMPKMTPREYWDYWSGKFLIFESTLGSVANPHVIKGSNFLAKTKVGSEDWIFDNQPESGSAMLTGNSTFSMMRMAPGKHRNEEHYQNVYTYTASMASENFWPYDSEMVDGITVYPNILPTSSVLWTNIAAPVNMVVKRIGRDGRIIYDNSDDNNGNTTHIPTVGGGNDLFITSIAGGINVAVAVPQYIRVVTSTGAIIYTGMVQNAVDIALPTSGIYIISGENEVQKILF